MNSIFSIYQLKSVNKNYFMRLGWLAIVPFTVDYSVWEEDKTETKYDFKKYNSSVHGCSFCNIANIESIYSFLFMAY